MEHVKTHPTATSAVTSNSQAQKNVVADPAAEAKRAKVDFYRTDKWVVGRDNDVKTYVVPKNTIPEPLAKAFMASPRPDPVSENLTYDRKKFMLDELTDDGCDRVAISTRKPSEEVADIQFDKTTFVVTIFDLPKSGVFSFNKDEFLKAVDAAKWQLELFVLPRPYNASDSKSETR